MNFPKIQSHSGTIHAHLGYGVPPYHAMRVTTLCEMGFDPAAEPVGEVDCPFCLQIIRGIEDRPYDPQIKWKPDQILLVRCNTALARLKHGCQIPMAATS